MILANLSVAQADLYVGPNMVVGEPPWTSAGSPSGHRTRAGNQFRSAPRRNDTREELRTL